MPIFVFEGIDGTGKETQVLKLRDYLVLKGYKVIIYTYPDYKGPIGQTIDKFLHKDYDLEPDCQFHLYRLDMLKDSKTIKSYLGKQYIILIDRWYFSTIAYQCAQNFDFSRAITFTELHEFPVNSGIFLITVNPKESLSRKQEQKGHIVDRFEEKEKFLAEVNKFYLSLANINYKGKWIIIDGNLSKEKIHNQIITFVDSVLKKE